MQRLAGEKLPGRLVEHRDLALVIDGQQGRGRIVDHGSQEPRLFRAFDMSLLKRLYRQIERLAKHIEAAAARVRKALRIIFEANRLDEARNDEVGPPDVI